jgi:hypothetical protein
MKNQQITPTDQERYVNAPSQDMIKDAFSRGVKSCLLSIDGYQNTHGSGLTSGDHLVIDQIKRRLERLIME